MLQITEDSFQWKNTMAKGGRVSSGAVSLTYYKADKTEGNGMYSLLGFQAGLDNCFFSEAET